MSTLPPTATPRGPDASLPTADGAASPVAGSAYRWWLAGVLLVVAVNAVYGGVGLIADGLGMPDDWLERTPFGSWTWPGVALLVTVALPQLLAASLVVTGRRRAAVGGVVAGVALVLWIVVQLLVLRRYFFLQPVIAGFGVVEVGLGLGWLRRTRPHHR